MAFVYYPTRNQAARAAGFNSAPAAAVADGAWRPAVDIHADEAAFFVVADLPGVDPKTVEIEVMGNVLTLKGERVLLRGDENTTLAARRERVSGKFERRFTLPDSVDVDQISAKSELGVLSVTIPKRAAVLPRRIEVQ